MFLWYSAGRQIDYYTQNSTEKKLNTQVRSFGRYLRLKVRKRTFGHVRPTKTQARLSICAVWSVFVVCMKKLCISRQSKKKQTCAQEDSDQTARMRSLIWIFAGRTCPKVCFRTFGHICQTNPYVITLILGNIREVKTSKLTNIRIFSQSPEGLCMITSFNVRSTAYPRNSHYTRQLS